MWLPLRGRFLTYGIYRLRLESAFRKYAGDYIEMRKFPLPGQRPELLTITVDRNILRVDFEEKPGRSVHGEVVMNRASTHTARISSSSGASGTCR